VEEKEDEEMRRLLVRLTSDFVDNFGFNSVAFAFFLWVNDPAGDSRDEIIEYFPRHLALVRGVFPTEIDVFAIVSFDYL